MKIIATLYVLYPHSTSFQLPHLFLLYLSFLEYHWLAIISECQTKKMEDNKTSLFLQNTRSTTHTNWIKYNIGLYLLT